MDSYSIVVPTVGDRFAQFVLLWTEVRDLLKPASRSWLIVVQDGPRTEANDKAAQGIGATYLSLPKHAGKGAAIASGIHASSATRIILCDDDLPCSPAVLCKFVRESALHDVLWGTRKTFINRRRFRVLGTVVFATLSRRILALRIEDVQCCLKAFSRSSYMGLIGYPRCVGFDHDVELACAIELAGIPVRLVEVEWQERTRSSVNLLIATSQLLVATFRLGLQVQLRSMAKMSTGARSRCERLRHD